jgi:hypothetical protein
MRGYRLEGYRFKVRGWKVAGWKVERLQGSGFKFQMGVFVRTLIDFVELTFSK